MIKYINIFKQKNKLKYLKQNTNNNILVCDRGRPGQIYFSSLFALNINKKRKLNIFVVSDKKVKTEYNKNFYGAFNINDYSYINFKKIDFTIFKSLILTFFSMVKIKFTGFNKFVENFSINKIYCGDLIWDTYIRHDHSFQNPKLDFKFIKILFITIYKIFYLEKIFSKKNIKVVLTSANNYSSLAAIALRIGVKYKIKTFFQKFHLIVKISKFNDIRKSPFQLTEKLINKKYEYKKSSIFEKYFLNRLQAKSLPVRVQKSIDVISAYKNKINDEKIFFELIKRDKKKYKLICVFAPHAFSDCNHVFGNLIFRDYYHHFTETIEIIKNDKNNLWIIKPHPTSYWHKEENIVKDYLKEKSNNNMVLCPSNISTSLMLKIADKIVTTQGTIGLEAACLGKKAILTGSSPYSHLGISINPKNKNSYQNILLSSSKNKKLNNKKKILAKKYLYWYGKDRMYDNLNFIENNWKVKNSFIKNLIKLQKKKIYNKKVNSYFEYIDSKF